MGYRITRIPGILDDKSATGWPFNNRLTVDPTNVNADYSTIADAVSGASAGDVIWLNPGTYTLAAKLTINKSIAIVSDNPEDTEIVYSSGDDTIEVTADDVTLQGLTITNDSTGTGIACVVSNNDRLTMRNCVADRGGGGTPVLAASIWNTGGANWVLDNVKAVNTVAATFNSEAFRADTAASSTTIINGSYDGVDDDIILNRAGATVELRYPVLENNNLNVTLGTATGWYLDASGNVRSASGDLDVNASDIILDADADTKIDMSGGDDIIRINTAGNKAMDIDAIGAVTIPLQPAVSAYKSSTSSNVTGDNTAFTIVHDTEITDRNGDYNNGTGVFTAPVTGLYQVTFGVYVDNIDAGHNRYDIVVTTSNRSYTPAAVHAFNVAFAGDDIIYGTTVLADMDASDTLSISATVYSSTKTVDVVGSSPMFTYLGVFLLG